MLVHGVDNPVNPRVPTNLGMARVNKNNLIVLHSSILVNPIRIQNSQVRILPSDLLLSHRLQISLEFQMVDTLMLGLTKHHTTMVLTLASSTSYPNPDDAITLLGFVTETMGLFGTGGTVATGHVGALTVFPGTDTCEESEAVRLFVAVKLFHVLVSSHGCGVG